MTPETFYEIFAGDPGRYEDRMDRYRDFRAVFGDDQGARVLYEILRLCGVNEAIPMIPPVDPYKVHFDEGRRSVGIRVLEIMRDEPMAPPVKANQRKDKE